MTRPAPRRISALAAALTLIVVSALALAGCTGDSPAAGDGLAGGIPTPAASSAVADLPVDHLSATTPQRLAAGVTPPTNRWYSSLVFSPTLLPPETMTASHSSAARSSVSRSSASSSAIIP